MIRAILIAASIAVVASAPPTPDCVVVPAGTAATANGIAIPGITASSNVATAAFQEVTSGTAAPSAGAWCSGCVKLTSGAAAPGTGSFYQDMGVGQAVTGINVTSTSMPHAAGDGMYCASGTTVLVAPPPTQTGAGGQGGQSGAGGMNGTGGGMNGTGGGMNGTGGGGTSGNTTNSSLNTTVGPTKASTSDAGKTALTMAVFAGVAMVRF